MKLTNKEFIRLQKETHLFEHGFYDEEIKIWYFSKAYEKKASGFGEHHVTPFGAEHGSVFSKNDRPHIKRLWFREKFPEFFEEDKQNET